MSQRWLVPCGRLAGALTLALFVASAGAAATDEPTTAPLPRVEGGMHTANIWRIATDRAGRWAVTASDDKTARVWEVATGRLLSVLRPPQDVDNEGKLFAVAMSPDGRQVAVAGWTGWDWVGTHSIYLFDRASARMVRRIDGLPNTLKHLDWSANGRWIAASLGGSNGIRVFDSASGDERGGDPDCVGDSYSVHFSADSRRLLSTCYDGRLRVYAVDAGGGLRLLKSVALVAAEKPNSARFSPDGRRIAVGFSDKPTVQVLDAQTLALAATPSVSGIDNGSLSSVAWSADGRVLLAGGKWDRDGSFPVRRWRVNDWSRYQDVAVSDNTVQHLTALPATAGGGWLMTAGSADWSVLDAAAHVVRRLGSSTADLRGQWEQLRVSDDGRRVRFGYRLWGEEPRIFDLAGRSLQPDGEAAVAALRAADVTSLAIADWKDHADPKLDGKSLALNQHELSRSVAIAPDGRRLALGGSWYLRLFDRGGVELWKQPAPSATWGVNISADARFVIAAYGDGTIRWHRLDDGREVLAFFPHADRQRWIAWTPEGFYAISGPDAEELIGYHLNQGRDHEGRFVSARQLREKFLQPGLISRRLDADGDTLMADAVASLGDVRALLAAGEAARTPSVELLSAPQMSGDEEVTVSVRVRDEGGGIGGVVFYVDGRPEEGRQAGIVVDGAQSRTFALPPGRWPIQIAARNRAGVEGERRTVVADIKGPVQAGALHILAVGVQNYRSAALSLGYSAADARDVAREIADRARPLFKRGVAEPEVLLDRDANLSGIEQAFARIKPRMKPQDTLVIFLAGHGEATIGRGYTFLPWDFTRGAAGAPGEGLNEERLRRMLADSPPRTLLLIDSCDAGGAVEMLEAAYQRLNGLTQQVVIGASRRGELAKEGFEGHGVFSAALLRVMRSKSPDDLDRRLRVDQLGVAVKDEVRRILRQMGVTSGQRASAYLGSAEFPVLMR